jgi:excisionase family DNA binding protein
VPQAFQADDDGLEPTMTAKAIIASRLPVRRGLDENEAAIYLSLSPSFFRKLVADGRMPRPRLADGRRIYDIEELDVAFKALPREGGDEEPIFVSKEQDSWTDYQ